MCTVVIFAHHCAPESGIDELIDYIGVHGSRLISPPCTARQLIARAGKGISARHILRTSKSDYQDEKTLFSFGGGHIHDADCHGCPQRNRKTHRRTHTRPRHRQEHRRTPSIYNGYPQRHYNRSDYREHRTLYDPQCSRGQLHRRGLRYRL